MTSITKLRWFAVVVGLIGGQALLSLSPTAEFELFPTGMLILGGMALSALVLTFGMLCQVREGAWGPLLAGTLGSGSAVWLVHAERGAEPNWQFVGAIVALLVVPSLARMVVRHTLNRQRGEGPH